MENINGQVLNLLARKAQLQDELKAIEASLGQLGAIQQYVKSTEAPEPEPETEPAE